MSDEQQELESVRSTTNDTATERVIRTYASDLAILQGHSTGSADAKKLKPTGKVPRPTRTPPSEESKEKLEIPVNLATTHNKAPKEHKSIWARFSSLFVSKKKDAPKERRTVVSNENIVTHEKKIISPDESTLQSIPPRITIPKAQIQTEPQEPTPAFQQEAPPTQIPQAQKLVEQPLQKNVTINASKIEIRTAESIPKEPPPAPQAPRKEERVADTTEATKPQTLLRKESTQEPAKWGMPTLPPQEDQTTKHQIPTVSSGMMPSPKEQPDWHEIPTSSSKVFSPREQPEPMEQAQQTNITINTPEATRPTIDTAVGATPSKVPQQKISSVPEQNSLETSVRLTPNAKIPQPKITGSLSSIPPQNEESREGILARLREKASEARKEDELLVRKSISTAPKEDAVSSQMKRSEPVFTPPPANTVAPIHTYKTDFSDHIKATDASTTSILTADQNYEQPSEALRAQRSYAPLFFTIGALLLVGGVAGVFYAYYHNIQLSAPVATTQIAPSLITPNKTQEIPNTGTNLMQTLALTATNAQLPNGSIMLTYIKIATTTIRGATTTIPAPGGYLIARLNLSIPPILLRNIAVDSTVGIIHAGAQTRPFFLLHVASYDATFAGMLRWEHNMPQDFTQIYPPYKTVRTEPSPSTHNASTTASSTLSGNAGQISFNIPSQKITPSFTDEIIANHDVRILRNAIGQSIMLYGFKNKSTLIIARNPAAFIEILNRANNVHTQ